MQEQRKHIIIKRILFGVAILLLVLPLIQQNFEIIELKRLNGAYKEVENPKLNFESWFDGCFQDDFQKYTDQNIGFHNFFVRLYNQMNYSFFNKARAKGIIIGKENFLFNELYINAYLGRDYVGEEKINEKVEKLRVIKDSLDANGVKLIMLFAPGKGSFYPEYIPDKYNPEQRTVSNYETYRKKLYEIDFQILDFHKWFREMKDTSKYHLFPKNGIHWSKYGEFLVIDSLLTYISSIHDGYTPDIKLNGVRVSKKMQATDDDIEKGMNLLFDISDLEMAYPDFEYSPFNSDSLKILSVGDSYFNSLFRWGLKDECFNGSQFWYYNKSIARNGKPGWFSMDGVDVSESVFNSDVLILINTDATLRKFSFGFIDDLFYEVTVNRKRYFQFVKKLRQNPEFVKNILSKTDYTNYSDADLNVAAQKLCSWEEEYLKDLRVKEYIERIRNNHKWLESVKKNAKKKKLTLEKAIEDNAKYTLNKELQKEKDSLKHISTPFSDIDIINIDESYVKKLIEFGGRSDRVEYYVMTIKKDEKWLESIKTKAENRKITLDEAIRLDAEYMVRQEQKKKPHIMQGS